MQQEVYDADMVTTLQTKAQTQEEEMAIHERNERKQLKQSEETSTTTELQQSDKTFITMIAAWTRLGLFRACFEPARNGLF